MSRMTTFIMVISTVVLVFHIMGLVDGSGSLISFLLNPESIQTGGLGVQVLGTLSLIGISTIIVGFITKNLELTAMSAFATFLFNILLDIVNVYIKVREANPIIALILFAPAFVLLAVTAIDYWRGRD